VVGGNGRSRKRKKLSTRVLYGLHCSGIVGNFFEYCQFNRYRCSPRWLRSANRSNGEQLKDEAKSPRLGSLWTYFSVAIPDFSPVLEKETLGTLPLSFSCGHATEETWAERAKKWDEALKAASY